MTANRALTFALALVLVCAGCTPGQPRYSIQSYATHPSVSATLAIPVPNASLNAAMDALQKLAAENRGKYPDVRMNVASNPAFPPSRQTVVAGSDRYASALDDAHKKAEGIARKLGVALGAVQSVEEIIYGVTPRFSTLKGVPPAPNYPGVNVFANQPVTLYVVYSLAGSQSGTSVPRLIAVYGVSPLGSEAQQTEVETINVYLSSAAKTLDDATKSEQAYEALLRDAMRPMLAPGANITTTNVSSNPG